MTNRELLAWLRARTERAGELEREMENNLSLSVFYSRRITIAQHQAREAEAAGNAELATERWHWAETLSARYSHYSGLADARCTEALRMLELNQQIREALSPRTKK
ncbi:MAG: hypothetical protein M3Z21_06270 [Pseudomonadota bacterium]|nr:hypothetical protein [Pseudomonadota bacterium]